MPARDLRSEIHELASQISKEPENIHQLYAALQEKQSRLGQQASRSQG
jgi:Skp family chaperone for outer membrane proteins